MVSRIEENLIQSLFAFFVVWWLEVIVFLSAIWLPLYQLRAVIKETAFITIVLPCFDILDQQVSRNPVTKLSPKYDQAPTIVWTRIL